MSDSAASNTEDGSLRRLFELCGVAPLGVYTLVHVGSYATVLFGGTGFGAPNFRGAQAILEVLLVWLPWSFHALLGLWFSSFPLPSAGSERRRVALSRISAVLGLGFVIWHVLWLRAPIWNRTRITEDLSEMLIGGLSETWNGVPVAAAAHLVGLGLIACHLGLGLPRFFARRELLSKRSAQRLAWWISLGLFGIGAATVLELATGDFPPHFMH
ncbi:MAG TPA: hypothetical protein VFQ61_17930 [Polyangiaceae bacterium]|nr:hypothetical protein [Polyangiaceae bacterium]